MSRDHHSILLLFRPKAWILTAILAGVLACESEPEVINSVVLRGGAYVRIDNRQVVGEALDSSSLAALNNDVFSLEIWASGDTLPAAITENPTLFMVSDNQGNNEIGVYRPARDSSRIFVFLGESYVGRYEIPGCDWFDPEVFTQVIFTYDGTTATLFGNGQQLGSRTMSIDVDIGISDALVGADWDTPNDVSTLGNFWYGAIDEVRLWTKVLPADEIEFRYEHPDKITKNYSPTGFDELLGLWRFNRRVSSGGEIPDGSGKGNDAIIQAGSGQLDFTSDGA
ncbi:MAG: LamG domain-containing protein [Fidelibacterota bacterium]|nr:MAG: LamG domain-containing protein [Candidatus Neomarinimicrobiota bacterium]